MSRSSAVSKPQNATFTIGSLNYSYHVHCEHFEALFCMLIKIDITIYGALRLHVYIILRNNKINLCLSHLFSPGDITKHLDFLALKDVYILMLSLLAAKISNQTNIK